MSLSVLSAAPRCTLDSVWVYPTATYAVTFSIHSAYPLLLGMARISRICKSK